MQQLYVLIADDSEFMRVAYKRILESQPGLRVVAMAANGEEATKMAEETAPDVAILDVWMPKVDGIRAAHDIRKQNPDTAIVVISSYEDLNLVADLMQNGVERKAYLLKHSITNITDLVEIVQAVHQGQTVLDSSIVQRMTSLYCKHSEALGTDLNESEQDILGLMAEGYDDDRICETIHLDQAQLAECSASLYAKLGILDGSAKERRLAAVQTFVGQIHKVPLSGAYAVS
jgi:DNA-binding NarL/FixJ family response regulator